jgi:transcription elongation factor GreB
VTRRGLAALRAELDSMDDGRAKSPAVAQALAARRAELERRTASAVLVGAPASDDEVRFGAELEVRGADGKKRRIRIVGVDEADPPAGRIAFVAPLARALLGRRAGETVIVRTPGGDDTFEIVAISYDRDDV